MLILEYALMCIAMMQKAFLEMVLFESILILEQCI